MYFYTVTIDEKQYSAVSHAYQWKGVERDLGISREFIKRGALSSPPILTDEILQEVERRARENKS